MTLGFRIIVFIFFLLTDPQSLSHHHWASRGVRQPFAVYIWVGGGPGCRCNPGTCAGPSEYCEGPGVSGFGPPGAWTLTVCGSIWLSTILDSTRWTEMGREKRWVFLEQSLALNPSSTAEPQILWPTNRHSWHWNEVMYVKLLGSLNDVTLSSLIIQG